MTWWVIAAAAVVLLLGALYPLAGRRKRESLRSNDEAIVARSTYARLGFYVENPAAASGEAAVLLGKARERWNACGSVLAMARSEADFELARSIAEHGMAHVRDAYERLGKPL